mmetsp:Transcript_42337/g.66300  ORF Transcript_42337/g.66300 Transcript_42337/m.66300 type:complete len:241 (-) Transcript_42337:120-842(-)
MLPIPRTLDPMPTCGRASPSEPSTTSSASRPAASISSLDMKSSSVLLCLDPSPGLGPGLADEPFAPGQEARTSVFAAAGLELAGSDLLTSSPLLESKAPFPTLARVKGGSFDPEGVVASSLAGKLARSRPAAFTLSRIACICSCSTPSCSLKAGTCVPRRLTSCRMSAKLFSLFTACCVMFLKLAISLSSSALVSLSSSRTVPLISSPSASPSFPCDMCCALTLTPIWRIIAVISLNRDS